MEEIKNEKRNGCTCTNSIQEMYTLCTDSRYKKVKETEIYQIVYSLADSYTSILENFKTINDCRNKKKND